MKKMKGGIITAMFLLSLLAISSVSATTGGPDEYGYTWDDKVSYSWIDISGTGTPLGLGDDGHAIIPIGFNFNFYGNNYTSLIVGSNGHIDFISGTGNNWYNWNGLSIPSPSDSIAGNAWGENPLIAPLFFDINPFVGGEIYHEVVGGNLIIQYDNLPLWGIGGTHTFQVILYRGSSDIKFQYNTLTYTTDFWGSSAVVGLDKDATVGLAYTGTPTAGTAILFTSPNVFANAIAAFLPVKNYHLRQVNTCLGCITENLPEDVPEDVQELLDEMQEHIDNANTTGNTIYANNELLKALKCCEDIQEKLGITCPL